MRFADKRYYIEAYSKCANCGVLIYDDGITAAAATAAEQLFCSAWCQDWAAQRRAGRKPRLRLPKAQEELKR